MSEPKTKKSPRMIAAWKRGPLTKRLADCAFLLKCHGYLPEAEYRKVIGRMRTAIAEGKLDLIPREYYEEAP